MIKFWLILVLGFACLFANVKSDKKGKGKKAGGGGEAPSAPSAHGADGDSGGGGAAPKGGIYSGTAYGDNNLPVIEDAVYNRYKDQVCNAVPSFKGEAKKEFNFMDEMTEDEVYELAFMNMAYSLSTDAISHIPEDMGYRKRVLDLISIITKQSCDNDVVPETYLNTAKNLFLYYLYKKEKSPITVANIPKPNNETKQAKEATWAELISMLEQCAENISPIPIQTNCDYAETISFSNGMSGSIMFAEEQVDVEKSREGHEFFDEVIDAVWWMFSTSYARCYTMYYPREDWVISFFDHFVIDFLAQFANRWKSPGMYAEYFPIIFGPYDMRAAKSNLRTCNGAAYQYEGISERQLVRPLTTNVDGIQMLNFKTTLASTKK